MTYTRLNNPTTRIVIQVSLAVAYVVAMRQLLALEAGLWGDCVSGFTLVSRMSLAISANLAAVFSLNYVMVRTDFYKLGLLIGACVFAYYYIYNPYGHNYILVYVGILRSPPHLFNMFLLVVAPALVGKLVDIRLTPSNANAIA